MADVFSGEITKPLADSKRLVCITMIMTFGMEPFIYFPSYPVAVLLLGIFLWTVTGLALMDQFEVVFALFSTGHEIDELRRVYGR